MGSGTGSTGYNKSIKTVVSGHQSCLLSVTPTALGKTGAMATAKVTVADDGD
jgi:hypothetical protein